MINKLKVIIKYYNDISNLGLRLWKTTIALASFNFGTVLKLWFYDKNFKDFTTLEQSFIYTQYLEAKLSKAATTGKYEDYKLEISQWHNLLTALNDRDDFLHVKLQKLISPKNKLNINSILDNLGDINSLEFSTLVTKAQGFLKNNLDQSANLIEASKKIDAIAYPLTKEYFLYRYTAKAILFATKASSAYSSYENEFITVKKTHLQFLHYANSLVSSLVIIEKATDKYNEDHKIASWLTEKSELVSIHSGKIAATYVTLMVGVIALRAYVIDEEDSWYELCALPTTSLAMLQIILSFPSTVLSNRQTKHINNNMFQALENNNNNAEDIKFLFDCTPSFSNNILNISAVCFRYGANFMLQPINLFNNKLIYNIIVHTALRWFIFTGLWEEQSKVTHFMQDKLIKFLYDKIVPALIEHKQLTPEEIKPYFQLLYKHSEKEKNTLIKLRAIYNKLTNQDIDFNNIESDVGAYYGWKSTAICSAIATLILDYTCFYLRNPKLVVYEDPMFYASTSVKLMCFASLLVSKYCGNQMIDGITGESLNNDLFFQKFYYNDAARLTLLIAPLIVLESTNNLEFISLATLADVLITAISDINAGQAISSAGKNTVEKTATMITWLNNGNDNTNNNIVVSIDSEEVPYIGTSIETHL